MPEPAAPADAEAHGDAAAQPARTALEFAGLLIAATTLISALAFFFGWKITSSKFAYLGIDSSALGFSTQDYLLRSPDALFLPLGALVVLALAALTLHAAVMRACAQRARLRALRRIAGGGVAVGAILFAIGAWGAIGPLPVPLGDLFTPASLGVGIALLAYALYVIALVDARRSPGGAPAPAFGAPRLRVGLVCLLVGLSAFWTTTVFAAQFGRYLGQMLGDGLDERPAVTVFSAKALHLSDAGATERRLAGGESAYRYRYDSLRLILRAGDRYFLVAAGWQPRGAVIVLTDDPSLRVEFRGGSGSS